jgi:ribosomal protein S6
LNIILEDSAHIINKIDEEIKNALPKATLQNIALIRVKKGVYVYRAELDDQSVVIKYFEKEQDKREISNYRILNALKIPTMRVIAYGLCCIVLEDIDCSDVWRLGKEEDLQDKVVALQLAHWYFDFHEKGSIYQNLDKMYHETDDITQENLRSLCYQLPQASETFEYIIVHLESLNKLISEMKQTFNYNDFYWTNLLVSKDKNAAMPFDYNLLGAGFRYNDIRNVTSSLSKETKITFLNEYNRLYEEKYGYSREQEGLKEKRIDNVTSCLVSLIAAFERDTFPSWANSTKEDTVGGKLLEMAKDLFE